MDFTPLPASARDPCLITDVGQASARWLTDALRRNGHLTRGEVRAVEYLAVRRTARSSVCRLAARYSADARTTAPSRFFLKFPPPSPAGAPGARRATGAREVEFYRVLAPNARDFPVVGCYDAVFSAPGGGSHLLLDDLSDSHAAARGAAQNVECLARIHAHWWGRLGAEDGASWIDRPILAFVGRTQDDPSYLARRFAGLVPAETVATYRRALSRFPTLVEHLRRGPVTLVHNDPHRGNFLHPRAPAAGSVKMVDWEWWRVGAGVKDLAFMIHRCRDRRSRAEGPRWETGLVRRYHEHLRSFGVGGYDWADCWHQYRLAVIRLLAQEVFVYDKLVSDPANSEGPNRNRYDVVRATRWGNVERATTTFAALGCAELV